MDKVAFKKACKYIRQHKFTRDERRNLRLGGVVSIYGISFAVEKGLLAAGTPISDFWWCVIYGVFALVATLWWAEDAILDIWENHTTEDDELYGSAVKSSESKEVPWTKGSGG